MSNIGKAFNRDHTTVLHSCELISSQMQEDRNLREELEAVRPDELTPRQALDLLYRLKQML